MFDKPKIDTKILLIYHFFKTKMHSIDKTKYSDRKESITNMSKNYGSYAKSQKQCCKYLHDHFLKNILDERIKAISTEEGNPRETKNGSILCFVDYGAADTQNSLEIYEDIFQKVHSFNQLNVDNCGNNRKIHFLARRYHFVYV